MKFASEEQKKAVMAKLKGKKQSPVNPPHRAWSEGGKAVPMKDPEGWLADARYHLTTLARTSLKDGKYRLGWQNAYESVEKSIKAAAPLYTKTHGPAYTRTHALVQPLVKLRSRYSEITDKMMEEARWMEEDKGYGAKYRNGQLVGKRDVQRAMKLAETLLGIFEKDPRRGL